MVDKKSGNPFNQENHGSDTCFGTKAPNFIFIKGQHILNMIIFSYDEKTA